jgi:hypothetical protein
MELVRQDYCKTNFPEEPDGKIKITMWITYGKRNENIFGKIKKRLYICIVKQKTI